MIENDSMITVGIVGEAEVGKTNFINKYIKRTNPGFSQSYTPTIAIQIAYGVYESEEGTKIRIKTWDTSGENKYKEIVSYHLKQVDAIIIMYDIADNLSFQKVKEWQGRLKKERVWPQNKLIIGNKLDFIRTDESLRRVKFEDGKKLAQQLSASFCEISVKNDQIVEDFNEMIQNILNTRVESEIQSKQKVLAETEQLRQKQAICECSIF